ncbi:MAG: aminopeptidase N [Deinococcus-Thermus bacterium]|jgi:aminopeptidase N|nr:aminopeptidase N [Deinococcota bacterium]
MRDGAPKTIRLEDYTPPAFLIDTVDLVFELGAPTAVKSRLTVRRNPDHPDAAAPLVLDGEDVELVSLHLDGEALGANRYTLDEDGLSLSDLPDAFTLDVETRIAPHENTELSGLYVSGGNFTTQCEAQGFRRITFFPDRPDVMARYTTTIVADKATCPVLLSNGNPVDGGEAGPGRHWSKWEDPWPKPAYLFALVAGDLVAHEDRFTTASGRDVPLKIYVRREDLDRCAFAMESLKKAMRWDETTFGLEYDLDVFNIVAVADFNMGAMENKGLNIFNTALLLAKPETATDADYQRIDSVVAHEYFHNWTGNRITCRDWFQLTLKEGLTVFRDQQYSADQGSPAVQRIQDVRRLRAMQFPEDNGPLAHPIRPSSYMSIDNFYTPTVYEKGAEVIRMIHTRVGAEGFRKGMDLYVARHDQQAVTCDDFVAAMADANDIDLTAFKHWYETAGTPRITAEEAWDAATGTFSLTLSQEIPPSPGHDAKPALEIPVALGLLGPDGTDLPIRLEGEPGETAVTGTRVVILDQPRRTFRFVGLEERPVPSLFRGFSAPVKVARPERARLAFLYGHDSDPFARWEAGQQFASDLLLGMVAEIRGGGTPTLDAGFVESFAKTLADDRLDDALKAEALALPSEDFLAEQMETVDVEAIFQAREAARRQIAEALGDQLRAAYGARHDAGPYRYDAAAVGRRALKNLCLALLNAAPSDATVAVAMDQFRAGANMTDVMASLTVLGDLDRPERQEALDAFYATWQHDALVTDKWFGLQARSKLDGTVEAVRRLAEHPAFDIRVPNRARALIGGFAMANPRHFHRADGAGYAFLADHVIRLDAINPQIAARLLTPLGRWRRQDSARQQKMRAELERILAVEDLSRDTYEIASKSLD